MIKIIQGTFDQSDHKRFPQYFGRQCTANAVAACCKASILQPINWTSSTIDECLISGDKLFQISYNHLPNHYKNIPYLRVEELQQKILFLDGTEITYTTETGEAFDGTSLRSVGTINNDGLIIYCIEDAQLTLFSQFTYAIFTCQSRSTAVFKFNNHSYLFDSHKRGRNGLLNTTNGTAILITFETACDLALHIKQLHPCSTCKTDAHVVCTDCQFSITAITIHPLAQNFTNSNSTTNNSFQARTQTEAITNVTNTIHKLSKLQLARMTKANKNLKKKNQKEKQKENLKSAIHKSTEERPRILIEESSSPSRNQTSYNKCKNKSIETKAEYARKAK
ncbi:Elongation factor Ts [Frankliniella fusca]|uniref:Elongation factor Ts n=1 Tax=Frankliniella fusca TaxID=407009 RepID=A0AAE1GXG3_9NEOP|nr:Elongation factor Ts [Frankliniella fusca]